MIKTFFSLEVFCHKIQRSVSAALDLHGAKDLADKLKTFIDAHAPEVEAVASLTEMVPICAPVAATVAGIVGTIQHIADDGAVTVLDGMNPPISLGSGLLKHVDADGKTIILATIPAVPTDYEPANTTANEGEGTAPGPVVTDDKAPTTPTEGV